MKNTTKSALVVSLISILSFAAMSKNAFATPTQTSTYSATRENVVATNIDYYSYREHENWWDRWHHEWWHHHWYHHWW